MRSLLTLFAMTISFHAMAQDIVRKSSDIPPSWQAFAEGSSITTEFIRQLPQAPVSKSQIKTVLRKSEHSSFTRYRGEDGFKKAEDGGAGDGTPPQSIGFKEVGRREEKITVAGKDYDSTVTTLSMEDRNGKKELILWEVKGLILHTRTMGMPGPDLLLNAHVVKAELTLSDTESPQKIIQAVAKLEEKLTVGKNTISCLVETLEGSGVRGGLEYSVRGELWTSEAVPGRQVKLLAMGTFAKDAKRWAGEEFSESIILVDFEAVKKTLSP